MTEFTVSGKLEIFDTVSPWVYLRVPPDHTTALSPFAERGLIPVHVSLGGSAWDTSLMPMGDGTHFIPLPARIRRAENVTVGDVVQLSYTLRIR